MKVAVVMAGGHVQGRVIAHAIRGHDPLVINETGTGRAERFSRWLAPEYGPPLPTGAVQVSGHAEVAELIRGCDYAVNGGAGLIKPELLATPRIGWLNAHPGLLPEYRGQNPVQWTVRNLDPIGATLHLMDEGIDAGPILIRREMPWRGATTIKELRLHVLDFCAALTAEFLADPGRWPPLPQEPCIATAYGAYHRDDPAEAERRLAPTLAHYAATHDSESSSHT